MQLGIGGHHVQLGVEQLNDGGGFLQLGSGQRRVLLVRDVGGGEHATGIREALAGILKPVHLKPDGKYLEGAISFDGSSAIFGPKIKIGSGGPLW
jgi:hypothetical protein